MRRALIVGINYEGTKNELRGCLNDAMNVSAFVKTRGFTDIKMILEKDATTAGIKAGLEWLVAGTAPGDVILFHYSGHGSQLPSKSEPDGFEEIICPIDLNWSTRVIRDVHLHKVFNKVPNGVNTTLILDCCHSGNALNQDEGIIDSELTKSVLGVEEGSRFMPPPEAIAEILEERELVEFTTERDVNSTALLVAGCHANQTSADAKICDIFQGAATYSLLLATENPRITYREMHASMRMYMIANKFTQRPELDGSSALYDEVFLEPFGTADMFATEIPQVEAPVLVEAGPIAATPAIPPAPTKVTSGVSKTTIVIGALLVLVLLAIVLL